jgi:Ran GTPase-activating protein (RanGAP) involved in mRNA processing and transport
MGRLLIQPTCNLFDLSLKYCNINNHGAKLLADALLVNETLLNVNLECNRIGDIGAEALASYLITRGGSSVRFIGLSNNMVGDDGANALAEAIRVNTVLTVLTLKNNSINAPGLSSFVEALTENGVMESLTLFGNKFSNSNGKQYLEFIKHRMPVTGVYLDIDIYVVDGQYKVAEN